MPDLVVIVPSRGRPENIRRLAGAWRETVHGDSVMIVVVDHDDPEREAYWSLGVWDMEAGVGLLVPDRPSPRMRLGGILNYFGLAYATESPARFVGFMGDDHLPRTTGWDATVTAALDSLGSGIVYGNDLLQGEKLPTAAFMTADIIRTLGWMVPPGLVHLYIDDAWRELGKAMGRLKYLPDVVIEHMHPAAGKASWDERYAEVNSGAQTSADKAAFDAWMANDLAGNVAALRAAGLC